jgi:hypothetical protein
MISAFSVFWQPAGNDLPVALWPVSDPIVLQPGKCQTAVLWNGTPAPPVQDRIDIPYLVSRQDLSDTSDNQETTYYSRLSAVRFAKRSSTRTT